MSDVNPIQNQNSTNDSSQGGTLVQFPNQQAVVNDSSNQVQSAHLNNHQTNQQPMPEKPQAPSTREQEPIPSQPTSEFIAPSEKSIELEPEVENAGVKETVNEPKLTKEDKIAGIEQAMESIPANTVPTQKFQYPLTKEKAEEVVKGPTIFKNTSKAMLWLAMLIIRQLKMKEKETK